MHFENLPHKKILQLSAQMEWKNQFKPQSKNIHNHRICIDFLNIILSRKTFALCTEWESVFWVTNCQLKSFQTAMSHSMTMLCFHGNKKVFLGRFIKVWLCNHIVNEPQQEVGSLLMPKNTSSHGNCPDPPYFFRLSTLHVNWYSKWVWVSDGKEEPQYETLFNVEFKACGNETAC